MCVEYIIMYMQSYVNLSKYYNLIQSLFARLDKTR